MENNQKYILRLKYFTKLISKKLHNEKFTYNDFLNDNAYSIIKNSNLFDKSWYVNTYFNVKNSDLDPLSHYISSITKNSSNKPNYFFDSKWYLEHYPTVKDSDLDPFVHYVLFGKNEGRYRSYAEFNFKKSNFYSKSQVDDILEALNNKVSIIIPIYNAYEETKICIESVLDNTLGNYELILINDNSPDENIKKLLDTYENIDNIKIIHNNENKGFVKNVNIGIKESTNDVILLNSDTIVTKKWLEKLIVLAYSKETIATVTPVSNNAGAFSVPEIGKNNDFPNNLTLYDVANIVEKSSDRVFMEAPTGNGFCMYIKRDAIKSVGLFDEINFGKGYGEENDFCMRAIKKGWVNVIDDTTYIYHKRSASFSHKKEELIKSHRKIIDKKYPTYTEEVKRFTNSKELKTIQNNVKKGLACYDDLKLNKKRILYVMHGSSGGTPQTNRDLMSIVENDFDCYLLTSTGNIMTLYNFKDGNLIFKEEWKLQKKWASECFYIEEFRDIYFNILTKYSIDLVHIRHLIKHTFDLPLIADKLKIPIVLSFHDFYFICPCWILVNGDEKYCGGNCDNTDANCSIHVSNILNLQEFVDLWRAQVLILFSYIDHFVSTSNVVKNIFSNIYPSMDLDNFSIIEHGRDFKNIDDDLFEVPSLNKPIKLLFIGNSMGVPKGSNIIKELYNYDEAAHLEFHFLGVTSELKDIGIHHGKYLRDDIDKEIKKIKPSFACVFSIWPETYCHVLSEAWSCGIPVLSTKIGVLEERMEKNNGGWFIDQNSVENTYNMILDIAQNKDEYLSKQSYVKNIKFKSVAEMGKDYLEIYKKFL